MQVLVMSPDPKPDTGRTVEGGQRAIAQSNSRRPQLPLYFLELQGRMRRVDFPEDEILLCKPLNPLRQPLIISPEPRAGAAVHGSGRVLPCRCSSSASSMNRSSLPVAASSSICLSQSPASYSASHLAIWRTSADVSFAISA